MIIQGYIKLPFAPPSGGECQGRGEEIDPKDEVFTKY